MFLLHRHALPLLLAFAAILLSLAGPETAELARYERSSVLAGAWWRLITGNLVHLSWSHLTLNIAGLILIWILVGPAMPMRQWWWVALLSALSVGLGLLLFNPELEWYVGLSGMEHGLFAAGLVVGWPAHTRSNALLLALLAAKLAFEQWHGSLPLTTTLAGGHVVTAAHLYGAIGGTLAGLGILLGQRHRLGNA